MNSNILHQSYYQLFDLPLDYKIDLNSLKSKMRDLQQQYHPDNHANDPEKQAQALTISSYINSGYQTLLEPLSRAIYLLKLNNIEVDLVHDTKFTPDFLMQQIELREQISEAETNADFDQLTNIESMLHGEILQIVEQIEQLFIVRNFSELVELIKKLSFYVKLSQLVDNILANL